MTAGRQKRAGQEGRSRGGKRRSGALVAHRLFAPLLGLWGALLGGLVVMVLPPALIAGAAPGTAIAALGQPVLAGAAAVALGVPLFVVALACSLKARRTAHTPSIAEVARRRIRPIDPARDLGSRSLDDPLETMPFATPAWRDAAVDEPDPQAEQTPAGDPEAEAEAPAPRALDLAEFAELPGRNAVWVEEPPAAEPAAAPVAPEEPAAEPVAYAPVAQLRRAAPPEPGKAALARLRAVPPSELSLAEMVERFAAALHEHRASPSARALSAADLAAREAALAEALKALAALGGERGAASTAGPSTNEPLRAALARLQGQRGAA